MSARKPRYAAWLMAGGLLLAGAVWMAFGSARPDPELVYNATEPAKAAAHDSNATAKSPASSARRTNSAAVLQNPPPTGRDPRDSSSGAATTIPAYTPATVQPDAAHSLAQALHYGDDRSPPIAHEETPAEAPTPAELADPAAYRRYENRRQEKLYRAYDQQAVIALSEMQHDLQRARDEHLPPELIQEGEEKAARLAQTLRALREGKLGESPASAEGTEPGDQKP